MDLVQAGGHVIKYLRKTKVFSIAGLLLISHNKEKH
jgi:hypothetical protein